MTDQLYDVVPDIENESIGRDESPFHAFATELPLDEAETELTEAHDRFDDIEFSLVRSTGERPMTKRRREELGRGVA